MKRVGKNDPLFLFDEVDKIASGKGDPSAALLEILDPEQNNEFVDRYLEFPVDLSKVLFICTANDQNNIPAPLLDRMELIEFRSYTKEEKIHIIKEFLKPNNLSSYSLDTYDIQFDNSVIEKLANIEDIRQIDKRIKKLLRMSALDILMHEKESIHIDLNYTKDLLNKKQNKNLGF